MSNSNNSYLNGSDLTRAVATTASVLVSSTSSGLDPSSLLIQNKSYKSILSETINNNKKNNSVIKKHIEISKEISSKMPVIKRSTKKKKKQLKSNNKKDFEEIPDELLFDIPNTGKKSIVDKTTNNDNTNSINSNGNTNNDNNDNNNSNDDLDQKDSRFSLFQGFNAVLLEVDDAIEILRKSKNGSKLLSYDPALKNNTNFNNHISFIESILSKRDNNDLSGKSTKKVSNPLPNGITPEKIKLSQNYKQLKNFKNDIDYKLEIIEVKKGLASNDISDIDKKIELLYRLRKQAFDKIADYEQEELYLENQLDIIETRMELVKDVVTDTATSSEEASVIDTDGSSKAKNTDDDDDDESEKNSEEENAIADDNDDEDYDSSLLSKSIYMKLRKNSISKKTSTTKKNHNKTSRNTSSSRKHKPTLQQYYKPGSKIKEIKAHEDSITCLGFDQPFGTLVTASRDNTVRVWDLSRGKCTGLLEGHYATVTAMQMEDSLVVTGSLDATLKLWRVSKLNSPHGNDDEFNIDAINNTKANGIDDDLESPLLTTFESHVQEVTALHFNNSTLVSGSADRTIRQWDLNTGNCLQTIDVLWSVNMMNTRHLNQGTGSAIDLSLGKIQSGTGKYPFIGALQCYDAALASGTADGIVRLWDLRSGEIIRQLIGHTGPVTSLQFDSTNLTTGSSDRSIRIWDLRTGGMIDSFAYDSPISSLQFDESKIVSANGENTVKIYDRIDGRHWKCGEGEGNEDYEGKSTYARYKEGYLVEGRNDGTIGVWAI